MLRTKKTGSNSIYRVGIILFLITGIISCKRDTKKTEAKNIVAEWTGKEIVFPVGIPCNYLGQDTICSNLHSPYKILLYTDSTGCTDCKLQLYKWNALVKEAETDMPKQIGFHFYFQPKDENELKFMFRRDYFNHTVYIDRQNKLHELNGFPNDMSYQCFLLDKDNRVLLIGNPTLNPKIWDLYKQTIIETKIMENENDDSYTTVEVEEAEIELHDTKIHESSTATFTLKNTGAVPLVIRDISTSCGCTIPEWDKKPIMPKENMKIKVKVTPDGMGYFRKTVTVFCNTREGSILLAIKSMVQE